MSVANVQMTSEEGILALLQLSPDAVLVVDPDGLIRQANEHAVELFRTTREDLEGQPVEILLPREHRESHVAHRDAYDRAPAFRPMGSKELSAERADGTRFLVDLSLQAAEVDGTRLVITVVRDITASVRLREDNRALAADAAAMRRFVSIASHELRTPLTSVRGFAEVLLVHDPPDLAHRRGLLERIVRNADRQEALIEGLLERARLEAGKLVVRATAVDVRQVVTDALEAVDIPATVTIDPGLTVWADALRVTQIIANLLMNADLYGRAPVVCVGRAGSDGSASITVTDHGAGVPEELVERLFEPFTQQSEYERRTGRGLGLGLNIARELALAMDGELTYQPHLPHGANFTLRLPLSTPPGRASLGEAMAAADDQTFMPIARSSSRT